MRDASGAVQQGQAGLRLAVGELIHLKSGRPRVEYATLVGGTPQPSNNRVR
jgi:hypothetical protein